MGGAMHVHRTARPPRSLPTVGMTGYFCVIFLVAAQRPPSVRRGRRPNDEHLGEPSNHGPVTSSKAHRQPAAGGDRASRATP
jgi:hypothetical protein